MASMGAGLWLKCMFYASVVQSCCCLTRCSYFWESFKRGSTYNMHVTYITCCSLTTKVIKINNHFNTIKFKPF